MKKRTVVVDESVNDVIGTTANLVPGDTLTVWELLYGLMLPSGNDAAHCLALHFGELILEILCKELEPKPVQLEYTPLPEDDFSPPERVD